MNTSTNDAEAAGRRCAKCTCQPNWQRIAVQIARYGYVGHGLTTPERDALEAALAESGGAL